jgi:hypothetical protein
LQVLCGYNVKAMIHLPGVDQVPALAPAEIEAVPLNFGVFVLQSQER